MTLASRLTSFYHRRRRSTQDYGLRFTDDGFELLLVGDPIRTVRWREVRRVLAFKVDEPTTGDIRLLFELDSKAPPVEVSEECSGFADIFSRLSAEFPSIRGAGTSG